MSKLSNDVADARIDHEDVKGGGFQTELDQDDIEEHVVTAHMHVADKLAGVGLDEERLARIELYLTRHLIRFTIQGERQVESEGAGPSSRDYSGAFGKSALEATSPGQTALQLDTSNTLGRDTFDEFYAV